MCQFLLISTTALQIVSSSNIVFITATRYLAISQPLFAKLKVTVIPCLVGVGFTWFLGWLVGTSMYARPIPGKPNMCFTTKFRQNKFWLLFRIISFNIFSGKYEGKCTFDLWLFSWIVFFVYLSFAYIIPFIIVAIMYIRIASIARNSLARRQVCYE